MFESVLLETIDCNLAKTLFFNGKGTVFACDYAISCLGCKQAGFMLTSDLYSDHLSSVES